MGSTLSSNYNDIIEFDFGFFKTFYNISNGKTVNIDKQFLDYRDYILNNNLFYEVPKKSTFYPKVVIGINVSSNCNLRCKYCFAEEKNIKKVDIKKVKAFIDFIVRSKKNAEVFFIDMAGSGEPLLYLKEILEIADYCRTVSDRIGKEVTPMLSTNGVLLNSTIVDLLQKHNILFGISLDGYKELHDLNRIDAEGSPTYTKIVKNIKNIKFNDYVGGSMTITLPNTDIYRAYMEMLSLFRTVSIRPCRMSYENFNFSYIKEGYTNFFNYLLQQTLEHNLQPLISIINGDDFFGKTILKIISNSQLERRCDAGVARFALSFDGKIFPCSPAIFHEKLEISKDMIEENKNNIYFCSLLTKCEHCIAKNICGSDCFVLLYEKVIEARLCEFK